MKEYYDSNKFTLKDDGHPLFALGRWVNAIGRANMTYMKHVYFETVFGGIDHELEEGFQGRDLRLVIEDVQSDGVFELRSNDEWNDTSTYRFCLAAPTPPFLEDEDEDEDENACKDTDTHAEEASNA